MVWFSGLDADGLHMSTHSGALLIAAVAYTYARRYANHNRFAFGTGKLGDLAAFTSAIALPMVAMLIGYETLHRFLNPVPTASTEAIPLAVLGFGGNVVTAFLFRVAHDNHHGHHH